MNFDAFTTVIAGLLLLSSLTSWTWILYKIVHLLRERAALGTGTHPVQVRIAQCVQLRASGSEDIAAEKIAQHIEHFEHTEHAGQTLLATVASATPFVGLLGTVWGIYHALVALSSNQSGAAIALDKIAAPVGEALLMTGLGLAVAIPALLAYNVFARSARNRVHAVHQFAQTLWLDARQIQQGIHACKSAERPTEHPAALESLHARVA